MKKLVIIFILVFPAMTFARNESAAALYNHANALYTSGDFAPAIVFYEKALRGGFLNSKIEYNLGNACLKKNPPDLARAVLHYERARLLDPRDADIRYNLKYMNALIKGKAPVAEKSFIQRGWESLMRSVSPGETLGALSVSYFILMTALIIYFLARGQRLRRAMIIVGSVMLLLMLIETPIAWGSRERAREPRAVILENDLPVRSGPGADNPELFKLFEGMVVDRHDCRIGWCQVAIPSGLAGWIPAEKAEKI